MTNVTTLVLVFASAALLAGLVAIGTPSRSKWRAAVEENQAARYLTLTLKPNFRNYALPAIGVDGLRLLQHAPGIEEVTWASASINDPTAAPVAFRLVSPGYPHLKYSSLVVLESTRDGRKPELGEVWISQSFAVRMYGSIDQALGRTVKLYDNDLVVVAVYMGSGPLLVVADELAVEKLPPQQRRFSEVFLKTKGPAAQNLSQILQWVEEHRALPEGLTLETLASVLRPDRAVLRDPLLNALRWSGGGVALAALAIAIFFVGVGVSIQMRERERLLALRRAWGASQNQILFEEALSQTVRTVGSSFLGSIMGILASLPSGGTIDQSVVAAVLVLALVLVVVSILPVVQYTRRHGLYSLLARSKTGLRAPGLVWLARFGVFASAATLLFSLAIASLVKSQVTSEIKAVGAGIYMLYPDHKAADEKAPRFLEERDLAWLSKRWPGVRAVLLNNFLNSAIRIPGEGWIGVNVRVSLGDFWQVVDWKLRMGDARGVVVTTDQKQLMGQKVHLRLGPSDDNVVECVVSGVVDPIKSDSPESPRLKAGWVWMDAASLCWPRAFRSVVAAIRVPEGEKGPDTFAVRVANELSKQDPNRKPLRAKPVTTGAREKAKHLADLVKAIRWQMLGLIGLTLLGVAMVGFLLARAWVVVYAINRALGASQSYLQWLGMLRGVVLVFTPAATGLLLGASAFLILSSSALHDRGSGEVVPHELWGFTALLVVGALLVGVFTGGLAARAALSQPPARWLLREDI